MRDTWIESWSVHTFTLERNANRDSSRPRLSHEGEDHVDLACGNCPSCFQDQQPKEEEEEEEKAEEVINLPGHKAFLTCE